MRSSLSSNLKTLCLSLAALAACAVWIGVQSATRAQVSPAEVRDTADIPRGVNLLVNPGFEEHGGVGTIPVGWEAVDEFVVTDTMAYTGWIAPRVETRIARVPPRNGRYMVGLDTQMMGVDTADSEHTLPRSGMYQTVRVPGKCRGTFSMHYNDIYSGAIGHVSAIRLGATVNDRNMKAIKLLRVGKNEHPPKWTGAPGIWSEPFFRVTEGLPSVHNPVSGWKRGEIEIILDVPDPAVDLTLWIGIFDNQSSTEIGYYRIDDAAFVLHEAGSPS